MYNRSGRDNKNGNFLKHSLSKMMGFVHLYRLWIYLGDMVKLPNFYKTVFRCFSPFEIKTHFTWEKSVCADFLCETFKNVYVQLFIAKPLRKKFGGKIWIFVKIIFNFSSEIVFFFTNMESNAAVILNFKDLVVPKYF